MEKLIENTSKERNYGLDILRILCFFGITMIHFTGYSNLMNLENVSLFNKILFSFLTALSRPAVNVFVLLTGFFMCEKTIKPQKLLKLWFEVFVVGVLGLVATLIINKGVSFQDVVRTIFPVTTYSFWFVTNYFILMILSPFINKMLDELSKNKHLFLCLFGIVWICVLTVFNPFVNTVKYFGTDWNFLVFLLLYVLGAYIKKYELNKTEKTTLFVLGVFGLAAIFFIVFYQLSGSFFEVGNHSIYSVIVALAVFVLFKDLKIKKSRKFVGLLTKSSFFIYLIQEYLPFRNILWNFVNVSKYANSFVLIAVYFALMLCLWICACLICVLSEKLYPFFERFFDWIVNKVKCVFCKKKENDDESVTENDIKD